MFFFIKGKVILKGKNFLVLENDNIGYQIFVPSFLLKKAKIGQLLNLFTYLYLRENTIEIYGFEKENELIFFKQLISIPAIGPKTALDVLSVAKIKDLENAILSGKYDILTKVSGIGRKTAERIIVEMRGKIKKSFKERNLSEEDALVIDALLKLGYSLKRAQKAIRNIPNEVKGVSRKVKEALKIISNK